MPVLLFTARCRIIEPNYRIVKYEFVPDPPFKELFGEYVVMNLMRERGTLTDGRCYWISAQPAFPH